MTMEQHHRPRPSLNPDLRARILAATAKEPATTRKDEQRRALTASAIGLAFSVGVFTALGGVHLGERSSAFVFRVAVAWALVSALLSFVALRRGAFGLGLSRVWLFSVAAIAAPVLCALYMLFARDLSVETVPSMHSHAICFVFTIVFALAPFVVVAIMRRGTDPAHPRAFGAMVGAASGAWGGFFLTMHCPIAAESHVMIAHAVPALVLAAAGALSGAKIFGVR